MEKQLLQKKIGRCGFLPKSSYLLMVNFALVLILSSFNAALSQSLKEYNKLISEMSNSSDDAVQLQAFKLQKLATELQPTVYVADEIKAFGGGNPVCAIVDGSSVAKIYTVNQLFSSVELLTIKLDKSGLSTPIDLSSLSTFPKLKYIRLLCEFSFTASQIESMVTGSNTGIIVCYLVSMPG